jgi:hypothetical protein
MGVKMARKKAEPREVGAETVVEESGIGETKIGEAKVEDAKIGEARVEETKPTYDPETQLVVDKAKFRMLVVSLASGRVGMYRKGALQMRLCELLGLSSVEEAQKFITEVYEKVVEG